MFAAPAFAENPNPIVDEIPAATGYLIGPDGTGKRIDGRLIQSSMPNARTREMSATYLFDVRAQDYSQWTDGADVTGGVTAHLTIYWTSPDYPNQSILLTRVSGGWSINDHQIVVRASRVRYGCSSLIVNDQSKEVSSVPNPFNYVTGFDEPVAKGDTSTGANLTLTLGEANNPSSGSWTLYLQNNYRD